VESAQIGAGPFLTGRLVNPSKPRLSPVQCQHPGGSIPSLTHARVGMGVNIEKRGRKMRKITFRNKVNQEKYWVDWSEKKFEDIREGMFKEMCLDEMIQWVEEKLKECQ